jgi:XTP/dITP diphosphohydrolase
MAVRKPNRESRSPKLAVQPAREMSGPPISLLASTRNQHKVREIRAILGPHFKVFDLSVLGEVPVIEETGETFEENATLKAVPISRLCEWWVIGEDSGLEVDALGGAPGVYSARYSGIGAIDSRNNALLLKNLGNHPGEDRKARFRCVIVLALAGRKLAAFDGAIEGTISNEPKGRGGFGYDPLFIPYGFRKTFGQLAPAIKNRLSHRAVALEKLRNWNGWKQRPED